MKNCTISDFNSISIQFLPFLFFWITWRIFAKKITNANQYEKFSVKFSVQNGLLKMYGIFKKKNVDESNESLWATTSNACVHIISVKIEAFECEDFRCWLKFILWWSNENAMKIERKS